MILEILDFLAVTIGYNRASVENDNLNIGNRRFRVFVVADRWTNGGGVQCPLARHRATIPPIPLLRLCACGEGGEVVAPPRLR